MAIVHRSMHDAIHTVREQGRSVTRSLLSQQRTLVANKLQSNMQIKRTSTSDPPSRAMSLPDQQELDWKRPMVSLAAVQGNQTVSHKQQEKQEMV